MQKILNIVIKNVDKKTVDTISKNLSSEFTRDTELEKNIQEEGSTQFAFRYKKDDIDASVCLINHDGNLISTNVVPRKKTSMPIKDCNQVILALKNNVLDKLEKDYALEWSDETK